MKRETAHEHCFMCRNYCHLSSPVCGRETELTKAAQAPSREEDGREPEKEAVNSDTEEE